MTYDEKEKWLKRYREAWLKLPRLNEQLPRARSFGQKTTVGFGGMPAAVGRMDRVQYSTERVAELEAEIAETKANMPVYEQEIKSALEQIQNPDYRRTLLYYYIECLPWADAAALGGYELRYTHRLRKRLVERLDIK